MITTILLILLFVTSVGIAYYRGRVSGTKSVLLFAYQRRVISLDQIEKLREELNK